MGNFFYKLNERLSEFMSGRNGSDKLARWCLGAAIVLTLVNMIFPNVVCFMLSYALLFYCIYRMFSRNVSARQEENAKFEGFLDRFKGNRSKGGSSTSTGQKGSASSDKTRAKSSTTVYFTCDECGQSLSVPKGKGTLKVTCPKCKHQTTIKS